MSAISKRSYLMKVHTSRSYKEISLCAKAFSVAIYTKLQAWAEQDACHAELLYADALSGEPAVGSAVPYPFILEYDSDPTDIAAAMSVIVSIMTDVTTAEALSAAVFQASGHDYLASISHDRIAEAQRITQYAANGGIFASSRPVRWQCSKCGFSLTDTTTPDACPCCEAKRSVFVRSIEIGE